MSRSWILCLVAVTAAAFTAGWTGRALAQERLGTEFQVNTYTTDDQEEPAVAADASGNFVVVWQSWREDGDAHGVFGQRFDSAGAKLGGEFQVNTYTTSDQVEPAVAAGASGGFVVVWESYRQNGYDYGVFGQRFDSAGAKVGSEFQVNTDTAHDQLAPAVAADASGGFVVVWQSYGQDGDAVVGQRFDSAGTKVDSEFQVNTYTTDEQEEPAVAVDASGSFVVVWQSYDQDGDGDGVFGQRFDSTGGKAGSEYQVNTFTPGYQSHPSVASNGSGGFVVVWENYDLDGDFANVFGQRFDTVGTKVGGEFQVNTYTTGKHFRPAVAADANGNFVVAWQRSYPGDALFSAGVFGQRLDSTGTKLGGEFQVNTYTTHDQDDPVVAVDPSGNFVVVWQSYQDGDRPGVFAQRFSALRSECRAAEKQDVSLGVKGGKLNWSWKKGAATAKTDFGDPTADTAYRVCLYDAVSGTPVGLCIDVPPGTDWKDQKNGFTFKSKTGVEGITSIQLEAGEAGKAKVAVKGKEVALPALPLTQQPEVVLELSNGVGQCWQSRFATARKNDESKFTAKE